MSIPLRALFVEDMEEDAVLMVRELKRGGFEPTWQRVDDEQALHVLAEWNARCEPPWSPAELLDKLHRAVRYGREPVGGLL